MNQCQDILRQLQGKAPFGDQWVTGDLISQSLLTTACELHVPGSGMPKRRLVITDLSAIADRPAADIIEKISAMPGMLPVRRSRRITLEGGRALLLAETPLPGGDASCRMNSYAAAKLGMDICRGIASLQEAGIVHRNIKPRNIVLHEERWMLDGPELADMMRSTVSGSSVGTRLYMSPESMSGRCDCTTDLYALAAVMYSILNNDRPPLMSRFDTVTDEAVENAISRRMQGEEIPPLDYADRELDRIIRRALSPNPARRYAGAAEMGAELSRYLHSADRQSVIDGARAADMADAVMADPEFASLWKLGRSLGAGSYGTVYRAISKMDGQEYALKLVRVPGSDSELRRLAASGMSPREMQEHCAKAIARASSEALMYMQLTGCSHIIRMYDCGRVRTYNSSGVEFFWMQTELLSPIPISVPDERTAAMIGLDVCTALSEIHSRGMTHRDVKPENILWSGSEGYKLSDFGIARMLRESAEATVIGSRTFMAPEILSGLVEKKARKTYNNTVDIFSLGMTLYTLLNDGREPFLPPEPAPCTEGDCVLAEQRRLAGEPLPRPAHCGPRLGAIIARACANDPAKRFRTADDMREALLNYLES